MSGAPLPLPGYITYADNVQPFIGSDKVLVSNTAANAVPVATADQLVAEGEALALTDISPYFIITPALITIAGANWTTLQNTYPTTYNVLYYMFVCQASLKLIGNFIARNTDMEGTTLSYFQNFYEKEYNRYQNRIIDMLPNDSYRYQMFAGLQPLRTGIPRQPVRYSRAGNLGAANYTNHQTIDPGQNFDTFWGNTCDDRGINGW